MDPLTIFGRSVRAARLGKRWTQEVLAERTGLAAPQISRIERGAREVRLTTLIRLLQALEVEPELLLADLYSHDGSPDSSSRQV